MTVSISMYIMCVIFVQRFEQQCTGALKASIIYYYCSPEEAFFLVILIFINGLLVVVFCFAYALGFTLYARDLGDCLHTKDDNRRDEELIDHYSYIGRSI